MHSSGCGCAISRRGCSEKGEGGKVNHSYSESDSPSHTHSTIGQAHRCTHTTQRCHLLFIPCTHRAERTTISNTQLHCCTREGRYIDWEKHSFLSFLLCISAWRVAVLPLFFQVAASTTPHPPTILLPSSAFLYFCYSLKCWISTTRSVRAILTPDSESPWEYLDHREGDAMQGCHHSGG